MNERRKFEKWYIDYQVRKDVKPRCWDAWQAARDVDDEPDLFWNCDNPEDSGQECEQDLADYCAQDLSYGNTMIVDVLCAKRLPNRKMKIWVDGDDDLQWRYVDPKEASTLRKQADAVEQGDAEPVGTQSLYEAAKSRPIGSNLLASAALMVELIESFRSHPPAMKVPEGESLQDVANKVCGNLPEGWLVSLWMESGAAWVEVIKPNGSLLTIDGSDLSLIEQINKALMQAIQPQEGE